MNDEFSQPSDGLAGQSSGMAERVQGYAEDTLHTARVRADEAIERGQDYVRQNPVPVVLGALAVGVLVGIAIGRRDEPTLRERYVDEPLDQAHDLLHSLLAPVAKRLRHEYGDIRSQAVDAGDKIHDGYLDPVFRRARRAADKLKFW